ncbi:MAG: shikimate dehydrogenase [Acidobacteriota bacterium]|nr:shikimate dehydrogenase [Acidobacteriota bacterium]
MDKNHVRICVPVCEGSITDLRRASLRAAQISDIVEFRIDCLVEGVTIRDLEELAAELNRPVIMTFRSRKQGGLGATNLPSFMNLLFEKQQEIDIELEAVEQLNCQSTAPPTSAEWQRIICSHHDFTGVPEDLDQIYARMIATPAGILKIAVMANDIVDCLPVFQLLKRARDAGRQMIAIAMGPAGVATRILGPAYGSYLSYGALDTNSATAPGQVTAQELRELYRIDLINPQTQVMGIVGFPVGHSISPQIHNSAFTQAGINAVYIPLEVREVSSFMKRMVHPRSRKMDWNLRGLSVTAPHKSAVLDCLDWVDDSAKEIGAVNTIVIDGDTLRGYNTDAPAVLKPVSEKLGSLRDSRCAVIGAGGAANAVLWSLRNEGARATVFARDLEKGRALAEKFDAHPDRLEGASFKDFDFIINATPLGTLGVSAGETPATAVQLRGARLAYDLVYNPSETLFLKEARDAGCETIGGLEMLVLQAAEQFKLWTGEEAPVSVMRETAERAVMGF